MTTTAQVDVELVHQFWRLKHADWADEPADAAVIRAEIDRLLDTRFTLTGGTHAAASTTP